jgi:NAD(P)-dependent dehydrogenase (short-subunit alcohol dehydrogenase family)
MTSLNGKVAIVTGASSGIGRATALLFAREGAEVVVTARRRQALEQLVAEIAAEGGTAVARAGDIRDETCAKALVALAVESYGGLDIAFNNAGTLGEMGPATGVSLDGWLETLDTNLTGAFIGAKHQLRAMIARGGGSLIFTSTFVGHTAGMPGMAAYAASKAGLIGLTQVLAADVGAAGIRVNAILPGGTDTPMGRTVADTPEATAFVENLHALSVSQRPRKSPDPCFIWRRTRRASRPARRCWWTVASRSAGPNPAGMTADLRQPLRRLARRSRRAFSLMKPSASRWS